MDVPLWQFSDPLGLMPRVGLRNSVLSAIVSRSFWGGCDLNSWELETTSSESERLRDAGPNHAVIDWIAEDDI